MRSLFEQITHEQVTSNTYYEHELFLFTYLEGFSSRTALGSAPCSRRTYIDVRRTRSVSPSVLSIFKIYGVCVLFQIFAVWQKFRPDRSCDQQKCRLFFSKPAAPIANKNDVHLFWADRSLHICHYRLYWTLQVWNNLSRRRFWYLIKNIKKWILLFHKYFKSNILWCILVLKNYKEEIMQAKFWKKHDGPKMELKVIQTNFGCINTIQFLYSNMNHSREKEEEKLTYDIDSSNFAP